MLFTLFNSFINTKQYDSKDRHMLKLFLDEVRDIMCELMLLNDKVNIHYMLQIFEREFGERIPKDKYDIKMMTKIFGDELLETLKITSSMQRCAVLEMTRVTRSANLKSKHLVICISGFL